MAASTRSSPKYGYTSNAESRGTSSSNNGTEKPSRPALNTKKVRISSPPRSPPDPSSPSSTSANNSAPRSYHDVPSTPFSRTFPSELDEEADDPFEKVESSEDEKSTDTEQMPEPIVSSKRMSVAPPNPFSRTLATMEEPLRGSIPHQHPLENKVPPTAEKRSMRASMDVDAFKKLLMTGKAPSSAPVVGAQQKHQSITLADNSSSTDTSSVSRHSLLDHVQEMASETPRSSYELSISEDDDRSGLLDRRKSVKVKPPPPRHRHGKAVIPKGPQIVSFSDFAPTISSASTKSLPITVSSPPSSPIQRRSSDLNKPLPAPPLRRPSSRDSASIEKDLASPRRSLEFASTESLDSTISKRVPPAPPLARRSSTLNPTGPRSRSNTQASATSQPEGESPRAYASSIAESTTSSVKMPPPPPPARRSGAAHNHTNPMSPSSAEDGFQLSRTSSLKSPLPPPSRNRSLSTLSSPTANSSNMMSPPPRPPPRQHSSRSSLEQAQISPTGSRRTSGEQPRSSVDIERRASMTSIVREDPITEEEGRDLDVTSTKQSDTAPSNPPPQQNKDVLAEMEAFQREIDALREKFCPSS
jgi:hypothetical protein